MRRAAWLTLIVAVNAILATLSQAHTNSCISATDGFWEEFRIWSLHEPPSIRQSAILITNAASETVTINEITARYFKSTMTVSNLVVAPPSGSTDTLYLDNTHTVALHILDGLAIGSTDGPTGGGAELISTNSTLIVDGLLGGELQDNGTLVITGGSLITTNCSLRVADSLSGLYSVDGLLLISNGVVQARDVTVTTESSASLSSGRIEVIGGTMTLSSFLNVGDGFENFQGSFFLLANGGLLVVTNGETDIGGFVESSGTMTVSNATFLAADIYLGGTRSSGELTINDGTVTLSGSLGVGENGEAALGSVSLNGGKLIVTNGTTTLGGEQNYGFLTVSDGLFLGEAVLVAPFYNAVGGLTIQGGVSILGSNLQVGSGLSEASVSITGGQLFVTNAPIVVSSGYGSLLANFNVSGGQLAAKTISVGSFAEGALSVSGGSVTVSTGITLGDCSSVGLGYVTVSGGQLIVTNAAGTGFIDVRSGQLVLSGGVLRVDKLVMTNSCGSLVHTGGTLIVGSVVLDPNAFAITSIAREGNDLRVTWLMGPGQTNALQVSCGGVHGACTTNNFTDVFIVTNNTAGGTLTNYLDIGAATNIPARYYRARLAP